MFSRAQLLAIRDRGCVGLSREIKRKLFKLRIRRRDHQCVNEQFQRIPVCISKKRCIHSEKEQSSYQGGSLRQRSLVRVPLLLHQRSPRPIRNILSSFVLSNLRSISNKFDEVSLKILQLQPNIAVFTESWLDSDTPDSSLSICNYTIARRDRNSRGGGIICYVSNSHRFRVIELSEIPSLSMCSSEILPIIFIGLPLLLICVYHPFWNAPSEDAACIDAIQAIIDHVSVTSIYDPDKLKTVLCGDFNGLHNRYDEISTLIQLPYIVNSPTRGSNVLDQIFTNVPCSSSPSTRILPPLGKSDHSLILWSNNIPVKKCHSRKLVIRKVSHSGKAKFFSHISAVDWVALLETASDLNSCASLFLESLKRLLDICFPARSVRLRSSDPPWLKPALKILINDRDRAWTNGQRAKYLRLREETVRLTRHQKAQYLKTASTSGDVKGLWKSLRVVGRHKRPSPAHNFNAADLNASFSSNFQVLQEPVPIIPNDLPCHDIFLTLHEVSCYLRRMKKKSPGPDGIPAWIFREFYLELAPAVAFIFNWSLKTCEVPSCFKLANITPVPKCPKPSDVSHFRPISLTPALSKLLERIVVKRWILPYVCGVMRPNQFAYVPGNGKGCTVALTLLYHKIIEYLDGRSGAVRILSVDYSKAFDKITHSGIIEAVVRFKIPVNAVRWISNFLSNRYQRVFVNNQASSWSPVCSGVPQGSVVGPILFCLFVDSLQPICQNSLAIKYADDVSIAHFIRSASEDKLQVECDHIVNWSRDARLPLNLLKCCTLDIVTNKSLFLNPVCAESVFLPRVSFLKILGVTFSNDLKWNKHFESVLTKATKRVFLIRNLCRAKTPVSLIVSAYIAFVRSILLFSFPTFCNAPQFLIDKLLRIERRILRFVSQPPLPLLSISEAGELYCRRLFQRVQEHQDHPLRELFVYRPTDRTRRKATLLPPKTKTKRYSSSFIRFATSS